MHTTKTKSLNESELWPGINLLKQMLLTRVLCCTNSYDYLPVKLVQLNMKGTRLTWCAVWLAQMLLSECGRHLLMEPWHWNASSQPVLQFPESRWKGRAGLCQEPFQESTLTPPQQGRADRLRDWKRDFFMSSFPLITLELQLTTILLTNYVHNL